GMGSLLRRRPTRSATARISAFQWHRQLRRSAGHFGGVLDHRPIAAPAKFRLFYNSSAVYLVLDGRVDCFLASGFWPVFAVCASLPIHLFPSLPSSFN